MRTLLLDRIQDVSELEIHGQKYLSINEDIYEFHFPDNPIMPAAYMVECALQLSRISVWERSNYQFTLVPSEMKRFKFLKIVRPGTILEIRNQYDHLLDSLQLFDDIHVTTKGMDREESRVFDGKFSCKVVPFSELHHKENCQSYVKFLRGMHE